MWRCPQPRLRRGVVLGCSLHQQGEKRPALRVCLRNVGTRVAGKQQVMLARGQNSLPWEEWDLHAMRLHRKGATREALTLISKYGSAKVFGAVFTCGCLLA